MSVRAAMLIAGALAAMLDRADGRVGETNGVTHPKQSDLRTHMQRHLIIDDIWDYKMRSQVARQMRERPRRKRTFSEGIQNLSKDTQAGEMDDTEGINLNGNEIFTAKKREEIGKKKTSVAIDGSLIKLHPTFRTTMLQVLSDIAPEKEVCLNGNLIYMNLQIPTYICIL